MKVTPDRQQLAAAAAAFLAQPGLAPSTGRSYQRTLDRLARELGAEALLEELPVEVVTAAVTTAWSRCAPSTWNRHVAPSARSSPTAVGAAGLPSTWPSTWSAAPRARRPHQGDPAWGAEAALERLWTRDDVAVREKALWRFLYETAAGAAEALSINVENVDLDNKRVRVQSKGGDTDWLYFQTGSARLLPRLIDGRRRGPLFLAARAPVPARAPATIDRCPQTGRARLSYRRAEALFRQAPGGWDLHQLRHLALTHLAEQNTSLPLLMAKSRHASLRSLQRYARPGPEAVAALTAATDPARRRR